MKTPESREDKAKRIVKRQERLQSERAPWEAAFRDVDRLVNPGNEGGFDTASPGSQRGNDIYDPTAALGLDRYEAGRVEIHFSRRTRWHGLTTTDQDLNRLPAIRRWTELATDRLFAMRYASHAGFETNIFADIRQDGSYGTAPLWIGERPGTGLFYRSLHLSRIWFDEDFNGLVNTVHWKREFTAKQIADEFSRPADLVPEKIAKCAADTNKEAEKFDLLYAIEPNRDFEPGALGPRGKRYSGCWIFPDENLLLRQGGFRSFPIPVSRHSLSPGEKYGRSPALKVMPQIKTVNVMMRDLLMAGQYNVTPPLLAHDDDDIQSVQLIPNGITWGGLDEMGREMLKALNNGVQLPYAFEQLVMAQKPIRDAFFEQFFELLLNPRDRMTATEVMEIAQKEAALLAPSAGRYEQEKIAPMVERELDIALDAGQIPPPPPEFMEAARAGQASLKVIHENPLQKMSRLGEAAGFGRWLEQLLAVAPFDQSVMYYPRWSEIIPGLADVQGVRPSWVNTADEVAARKAEEDAAAEVQQALAAVAGPNQGLADATKKLAEAGAIREAA